MAADIIAIELAHGSAPRPLAALAGPQDRAGPDAAAGADTRRAGIAALAGCAKRKP